MYYASTINNKLNKHKGYLETIQRSGEERREGKKERKGGNKRARGKEGKGGTERERGREGVDETWEGEEGRE